MYSSRMVRAASIHAADKNSNLSLTPFTLAVSVGATFCGPWIVHQAARRQPVDWGAMPARISREDVTRVARLALLELTEEELERYTEQLGALLDYVEDVALLDLSTVVPLAHPLALRNVFRDDEPGAALDRAEVLAAAPAAESGRFRVPAILAEQP